MDRTKEASLNSNREEYTLTVPSTDGGAQHTFKGTQQAQKDVDCVLIFNEATNSYRLERLDTLLRLDHQRSKHRKTQSVTSNASVLVSSPAPIPSPAPSPESDDEEGLNDLANLLESSLEKAESSEDET